MLKTLWATVRQGKIELLEPGELTEGTRVLVTLLPDEEFEFWLQTSQVSLDTIWDNTEDDVYAELLKNDIILVRYPFSDLSGSKVRPSVVVNTPHVSQDIFIVPLTSKTTSLLVGELVLSDWAGAGLNVETAVKRGLYTVQQGLVVATVGKLTDTDIEQLEQSLRGWLGL